MKLAVCKNCDTNLCAIEVPQNVQIRCSKCGYITFMEGNADDFVQLKNAWRSLWLGLASIILIFLTGIPAVYFGIKALLKMRYQKVTSATKFAAIAGVVIGGIWGVLIGGAIALTVGFGLVVAYLGGSTTINDPTLAIEKFNQIAKFEIPKESNLNVRLAAISLIKRSHIEFWDDEKFTNSRNRLYFSYCNVFFTSQLGSRTSSRNNMRNGAADRILGNWDDQLEKGDESKVDWMIHGESREVTKTRYFGTIKVKNESDADSEKGEEGIEKQNKDETEGENVITEEIDLMVYQCLFDAEPNTVCITFMVEIPNDQIPESKIQAIFESYQPVVNN